MSQEKALRRDLPNDGQRRHPTHIEAEIWSNNPNASTVSSNDAPTSSGSSDKASVIRLVGALLVDINDEMIAADRRYIAAASVAELTDLSLPAAPRT